MLAKRLSIALVAVLLLAVSVAAVADPDESNPPSQGVAQISAIEPGASDAMAVLEEPRGAGDALPGNLADKMSARANFGMNPDLSRLSIGNATNSLYVIPARDRVCAGLTVGDGMNVTCPLTADVAAGESGAATVILETGGIGIYGIVPDGVTSVAVLTGNSSSAEVETENNAYYTVVPPGTHLRAVGHSGPSGPVEFPIYDPRQVFDD